MQRFDTLYVVVTGAATARRVPGLLVELTRLAKRVLVLPTPNSQAIVSAREIALVPGARLVQSYFDEVILPRPPRGVVLVAPCDFNSLNKLAQGIADNLSLSVTAEAIGRRTPVIVALSLNAALWAHPRAQASATALRSWGCQVLDPVIEEARSGMAPDEEIVAAVRRSLNSEA